MIKTLLMDMELTYGVYYAFPSKRPQYLSAKNIIHHQSCLCAAWKWEHQVSVQAVSVLDDKKRFRANHRDDYCIAVKLHQLMTDADVICAHNGDQFDIKHANTLFIKHGLGQIPEKKSIDTLKAARKYFAFAGNGLDDILKFFGFKGKSDKPCWIRLTEGDEKEIRKAIRYCKDDVLGLDIVLAKLKPYMRNLPRIKTHGIEQCPACNSKRLQSKGSGFDGKKMYMRVRCSECGHEMKGVKVDEKPL